MVAIGPQSDQQSPNERPDQRYGRLLEPVQDDSRGGQRLQNRLSRALGWFSIGLGLAEVAGPRAVADVIGIRRNDPLLRAMGVRELVAGIGILAQDRPAGWMWARVGGDVLDLALLGTALSSEDAKRPRVAVATAAVAGVMLLDVLSSRQLSHASASDGETEGFRKTITIERSAEDLYRFWRDLENLPRIMRHLATVRQVDERHSHWVARTPTGNTVEWNAEITQDEPNRLIAWRSLAGEAVHSTGVVRFEPAPAGRGTVVTVEMHYEPVAGVIGTTLAGLFGTAPEQLVRESLRQFKQITETGEIATTEGQPAGRSGSGLFDRLATR